VGLIKFEERKTEFTLKQFDMRKQLAAIRTVNLKSAKLLDSYFDDIYCDDYYYVSNGKVSTYQMISYFLDKYCAIYGTSCEMYITTWGMTEMAIRQLVTRKQSGQISKMHFVCSEQTKVNKTNEFYLMKELADSFTTVPCHAKIYLMDFGVKQISIITSANLNRNNKLEAGVISGNSSTHNFYMNFLNQLIDDNKRRDVARN
jgi:hypothetical protein